MLRVFLTLQRPSLEAVDSGWGTTSVSFMFDFMEGVPGGDGFQHYGRPVLLHGVPWMDGSNNLSQYTALDGALLGAFFISCSVLALVQLNNLFNGRFVLFVALAAFAGLIAIGFEFSNFSELCSDHPSAILCDGEGQGLIIFSLIWIFVSGASFALYGLVQLIRAHGRR